MFVTFAVAFAVAALVTPWVRRYALRWKLGDKPNGRKIHTDTIPHLGGIALFAACVMSVAFTVFYLQKQPFNLAQVITLVGPVGLIVALGLTDDIKNLKARQKVTIQIAAALLLALSGVHMIVGIPILDQNIIFVVLLTIIYLVGISSSVNLIDGHDGLAAGVSLISAAAFAVLAWMNAAPALLAVSVALVGACLGFLIYNFPPGKIFMGDTGSMFLGITLGILACRFSMLQPSINTFVAVTLILSVPMVDCWLAIVRRLATRQPIFQADCRHMHHMIKSFGFSSRQTLAILYSMQAVMAFLGVLVMRGYTVPLILGCVILLTTFFAFIRVMVATGEGKTVPAEFATTSIPSLEK